MAVLLWDQIGEREYETGVDHGVLYIPDNNGVYAPGVAWNGLTGVTETPSGAEANAQYADNIKYLNILSAEDFGVTIEAFTYPDEFGVCDGSASPRPGVSLGQQPRKTFGLSYRTKIGNDVEGDAYGYRLHLVYGCLAAPSERAYATVNDSPEPVTFSWEVSTTPAPATGYNPTALITIDSTNADADDLAALEQILYGTAAVDARLPLPDEVIGLMGGATVAANVPAPTYDQPTTTITIPTAVGVVYQIGGVDQTAGPVVISETTTVTAKPASGYVFPPDADDDWVFEV